MCTTTFMKTQTSNTQLKCIGFSKNAAGSKTQKTDLQNFLLKTLNFEKSYLDLKKSFWSDSNSGIIFKMSATTFMKKQTSDNQSKYTAFQTKWLNPPSDHLFPLTVDKGFMTQITPTSVQIYKN